MEDLVLAKRYAKAIFELASDERSIKKVGDEFGLLSRLISKNPEWIKVLDDLEMPMSVREKMIDEVASASKLKKSVIGLIKTLATKGRCYLWPKIVDQFKLGALKAEKMIEAHVTVVDKKVWVALEEDIKKTIQKISGKKPLLKYRVDPMIIGGLTIRLGDTIYDGSVRGELRRVKESLREGSSEIFRR